MSLFREVVLLARVTELSLLMWSCLGIAGCSVVCFHVYVTCDYLVGTGRVFRWFM